MANFKVFCADCKMEYEQGSKFRPVCCGNCGSQWIAVKLSGEACKRCGSELNNQGFCNDMTCPFSDHEQNCDAGWTGHPEHRHISGMDCTCQ